jgi:competence protein ComEA
MLRLFVALAFALFTQLAVAAVNLNTATLEELIALPGIGPAKAQAILDYRKAHGPFKTVEELKDVKGIGAKRFEKLKGELTVAPAPAPVKTAAGPTKVEAKPAGTVKGEIKGAMADPARK